MKKEVIKLCDTCQTRDGKRYKVQIWDHFAFTVCKKCYKEVDVLLTETIKD